MTIDLDKYNVNLSSVTVPMMIFMLQVVICEMTKKSKQETMTIDTWSYTADNSVAEIKHTRTKDQQTIGGE